MEVQIPDIQNALAPADPVDMWQQLCSLEMPSPAQFVNSLTAMGVLEAAVLLAAGLVYLLQGWKIFKGLIVINAAIIGAVLGQQLGSLLKGANMPLFGGIAGALLLAVLSWPLMKYALSLMGGLAGSFLGYGLWHYVANILGRPNLTEYSWAGALIGLITLGLLAFVVFKLVVMVFTAMQGSIMAVSGILTMLLKYDPLRSNLESALIDNLHLLPLLIAVPAVIGFAFQHVAAAKKIKKKRKAAEGD